MITVRNLYDGVTIDITLPSPCVYVDYAGLAILAKDSQLGDRFKRALIGTGGTLLLSWAHLLELYGLGVGPTYLALKEYLKGFDNHFSLIECDANSVISREKVWRLGDQNPAMDVEFIKCLVANQDQNGSLTFAVILGVIDSDPTALQRFKSMHREHRSNLQEELEKARQSYRSDVTYKATLDARKYTHILGDPPTEYMCNHLLRETIRTHEPLQKSDGIDFEHAVVSLAYSHHVVLDKKWAYRTTRYPPPMPAARVWRVGDLQALTEHLESTK
jgi:hypothetical protein